VTAGRYTVVFTGLFDGKKPGRYSYFTMSEVEPESVALQNGQPPYERMKSEIGFQDLPEDVRLRILEVYQELWNL